MGSRWDALVGMVDCHGLQATAWRLPGGHFRNPMGVMALMAMTFTFNNKCSTVSVSQ